MNPRSRLHITLASAQGVRPDASTLGDTRPVQRGIKRRGVCSVGWFIGGGGGGGDVGGSEGRAAVGGAGAQLRLDFFVDGWA